MGLNGKDLQDIRKIWKRYYVERAMRRYDAEALWPDLAHGLGHSVRELAGLSLGFAMDRSATDDLPNGYRLEVIGLPAAMESERKAKRGTYARLYEHVDSGLDPERQGYLGATLSRTRDEKWKVSVHGDKRCYDDAADAVADFVGSVRRVVEPAVAEGGATFRIACGSRMVAANVYRALAIAEEKYDPARRGEEASIGTFAQAPSMSL